MWDLTTSRCIKSLDGQSKKKHEVLRACWAPPGVKETVALATGSADGTVRLWGLPEVDETKDGGNAAGRGYEALKVVAKLRHRDQAKGLDGQVYSCQFVMSNNGGASSPHSLAKSCSSSQGTSLHLLTASDCSVHLWDVETRRRTVSRALPKIGDHSIGGERNPDDLSFIFDAKPRPGAGSSAVAVALSDGTVRVGDILGDRGETAVLSQEGANTHLTGLAWSDDGMVLVACGGNGTVTVWDARTWTVRSVLCGHSRPVYGAAFFPVNAAAASSSGGSSPQLLLSWSSDATICAWDTCRASGRETAPLTTLSMDEGFPIYHCSVSADGSRLAVAGGGGGGAGFMGVPVKLVDLREDGTEQAGER